MPKTVGIAVSNATFHFDKLYTYAVLPEHQNVVRLGSMVLVPFGKGSRARMGVVLACDAEPEHSKLKYLFDVAPASACLTPELLRLVQARRGGRRRDPGAAKAAYPSHRKRLQAGGHAAAKAEAYGKTAGSGGAAERRSPHPERVGR